VFKFDKTDFNAVKLDAIELNRAFFVRNPLECSIEDNWQFCKAGLIEIVCKRVPRKKQGTWADTPWITRDLKRLLRKKKRLYNNFKQLNNPAHKQKYLHFQKQLKVKICKAQDDFIAETLNINPDDKF